MRPAGPAEVDPRIERTRRVVLDATAQLLADHGFERLSIDDIAEAAGVARSTIYRNWEDRAQLLGEAFELICDPPAFEDHGTLEDDLRALGRHIARGLTEESWGRTLPSLLSAAAHDPDFRRVYAAFTGERRAEGVALLERAVERGEIHAGADTDLALQRYIGPMFYRHLFTDDPVDDAFVERLLRPTVAELRRT